MPAAALVVRLTAVVRVRAAVALGLAGLLVLLAGQVLPAVPSALLAFTTAVALTALLPPQPARPVPPEEVTRAAVPLPPGQRARS